MGLWDRFFGEKPPVPPKEAPEASHRIKNKASDLPGNPDKTMEETTRMAEVTLQDSQRSEKILMDSLARMVSPTLAETIVKNPPAFDAAPKQRPVTILILEFPDFFETTAAWDWNGASKFASELLTMAGDQICGFEGSLDSFQQGRLIALFGYPAESPAAPLRGLLCATALNEAIRERTLTDDRAGPRWPTPRMAVHCGNASVGPHGSEKFLVFTALGGCASQAFLFLKQGKPGEIVVSEPVIGTHAAVFDHEPLGPLTSGLEKGFRVKGIRDLKGWEALAQSARSSGDSRTPPEASARPPAEPPKELLECPNCGNKNPVQAKFCEKCGMPVF